MSHITKFILLCLIILFSIIILYYTVNLTYLEIVLIGILGFIMILIIPKCFS